MLCPRCNTVNKDTARQCRSCGWRLAGLRNSADAQRTENKYLIAGIAAFIALVVVFVLIINAFCCITGFSCSSCGNNSSYINENVDGDWVDETIIISESDVISASDIY